MLTQTSSPNYENSDITSYAKWFTLNELRFSLEMISPTQWVAKSKITDIFIETSINKSPITALMELHKIAKQLLVKNTNE